MAFVQSTQVANFGIYDRLSAALSSVKVALQRRAIFSQTIRELQNLSNRELADIGINRTDIHRIAMDAAFGPNLK